MRIKVELHPDVVFFLRHRCSRQEQNAFYDELEAIRREPIGNSDALFDPEIRQYMLRRFRFETNIAVFEYDAAKNRIRVLECRRLRPARRPGTGSPPARGP